MTDNTGTGKPPAVWNASKNRTPMRNATPGRIRVTLHLAGQKDREDRGVVGRLIASASSISADAVPHTVVALIRIDDSMHIPHFVEPNCPALVPLEIFQRLRQALCDAWRTAMDVDLLDEDGRPLLLGAIDPHPAGVSRWLIQYVKEGR